jgi:hypothetical protein
MSTSASSLNWWYMPGSRRLMKSAGRREAMSRKAPPCGEPRPAFTSARIDRATTSRVKSSGGRRAFLSPSSQREASSTVSAVSAANFSGTYSNMKRLPALLSRMPPSPRTPSVTRMPRTLSGQTMPVG